MNVSSLRKKMATDKMLRLVFLVGLLCLTFLIYKIGTVNAASAIDSTTGTASVTSTNKIRFTFSTSSGDSSLVFGFSSSTNGVTWSVTTTQATTTVVDSLGRTFNFTGLATDTLYYLRAGGGDASTSSTAPFASTTAWTYAAPAGTPTVTSSPTATTIPITLDFATNPTNTTYAIFNTTTGAFLAADGSANGSTPVWQTTSTWGVSFYATGLTANTSYQFVVIARNGAGITAATSSASTATTTLANTPSSLSVSASSNGFTFSWSGDATDYYAEDVTAGTNSGWITGTSFSVNSVNCGTTHSFRVKGRNSAGVETSFASSVEGTTGACGSAIVVGGGGGGGGSSNVIPNIIVTPAVPAVPAVPGESPATPATPAQVTLPSTASARAVFVHTLKVGQRSNEVKQLQAKLRELGYFTYPTNTGFFGAATKAAVVAFQKAMGLKPYPGHVGPGTRAALNSL